MKQMLAIFVLIPLSWNSLAAQKFWTLQECIHHALNNSPEVLQAEISKEQAANNLELNQWNHLPDVSLSSGQFLQNGRSIDRFTNTFTQTRIYSNNVGLQSNVLLFAGRQLHYNTQQSRYAFLASSDDVQTVNNNIALRIANFYLQALQARELLKAAQVNKGSLQRQLELNMKLFEAGSIAEPQILALQAQLSSEEVNIVNAQNQVEQALANLRSLLLLPFDADFDVLQPNLPVGNEQPEDYQPDSIFEIAQNFRPEIRAARYRVISAQFAVKAAQAGRYPTLSAGANLNTLYSENAKRIVNTQITGTRPIGFVSGTNELVETVELAYTLNTIPFADQYKDNFGQSAGMQFNWTLFGKKGVDIRVKQAQLALKSAQLQETSARYQLYTEIVNAYNGFRQAHLRYKANEAAYQLQQLNLDYLERRFEAGQANQTELVVARSMRFTAASNLIQSKYERIFRRMILDFYSGTSIELNP